MPVSVSFFSDDCLISLFKIKVLNYDIKIDPSLILGQVTILQLYLSLKCVCLKAAEYS